MRGIAAVARLRFDRRDPLRECGMVLSPDAAGCGRCLLTQGSGGTGRWAVIFGPTSFRFWSVALPDMRPAR